MGPLLLQETEDSTEEEIEPKFKYQRIAHDLKDILNKDVVTACAVHSKVSEYYIFCSVY